MLYMPPSTSSAGINFASIIRCQIHQPESRSGQPFLYRSTSVGSVRQHLYSSICRYGRTCTTGSALQHLQEWQDRYGSICTAGSAGTAGSVRQHLQVRRIGRISMAGYARQHLQMQHLLGRIGTAGSARQDL